MPLKLNVGLARKVGEANYGSRGASINVEMEVDSTLITEPSRLQERIRGLFTFVRHAVDEELNNPNAPAMHHQDVPRLPSPTNNAANNGNGSGRQTGRPATQSQVKAIYSICRAQKVDAVSFIHERYHIHRVEDLSLKQASEAIDSLKADQKGR